MRVKHDRSPGALSTAWPAVAPGRRTVERQARTATSSHSRLVEAAWPGLQPGPRPVQPGPGLRLAIAAERAGGASETRTRTRTVMSDSKPGWAGLAAAPGNGQ